MKYGIFSGAELSRRMMTYLVQTSWILIEVSRKHFFSTKKLWVNVNPSAFLGITVQGFKSKKVFDSKICMESICVILGKVKKFGQRISVIR